MTDTKEDMLRDIEPLQLSSNDMQYVTFRLYNHTKYICKPIVTPGTFAQTGML